MRTPTVVGTRGIIESTKVIGFLRMGESLSGFLRRVGKAILRCIFNGIAGVELSHLFIGKGTVINAQLIQHAFKPLGSAGTQARAVGKGQQSFIVNVYAAATIPNVFGLTVDEGCGAKTFPNQRKMLPAAAFVSGRNAAEKFFR